MGIISLVLPDDIDSELRKLSTELHGPSRKGKLSLTGTSAILLYTYLHQELTRRGIPITDVEDWIYDNIDQCLDEYFSNPLSKK